MKLIKFEVKRREDVPYVRHVWINPEQVKFVRDGIIVFTGSNNTHIELEESTEEIVKKLTGEENGK